MIGQRAAAVIAADNLHKIAAQAIIKHRKYCSQCNAAIGIGNYARTCDTGWLLVKDERAEMVALRRAEARAAIHVSHQLALW